MLSDPSLPRTAMRLIAEAAPRAADTQRTVQETRCLIERSLHLLRNTRVLVPAELFAEPRTTRR